MDFEEGQGLLAKKLFSLFQQEKGSSCLEVFSKVREVRQQCFSQVIGVSEQLDGPQQALLVDSYPEFKLKFNSNRKHSHSFSAASRKLELQILLGRLSFEDLVPLSGYDDLICDVGGEFASHLVAGRYGIHSCCPDLELRDSQRQITRMENLVRSSCRSGPLENLSCMQTGVDINRFFRDNEFGKTFYCSNKAQDCNRKARYGISLHSCYDISLLDFADIMIRKDMVELYGSFIFSDLILVQKKGTIPGIDCYYSVDEDKDKIEFSFEDDFSTIYSHSFKNYLALVTVNFFYDRDKRYTFYVELLENRCGIQFFKITKMAVRKLDQQVVTRYIWLPSLKGKTKVNFFEMDHTQLARGNFRDAFVPITFYVDTAVVDKAVAHAYASTETKFRPVEIFNFLLAYTGRIFFGSDVCIRNKSLPAYQCMVLANAIYLDVFIKKYDIGKIVQLLMRAIDHDRSLAHTGLFGKLFAKKFSPPIALGTDHHSKLKLMRKLFEPLHGLLYWLKRSPYTAHKFLEDNVKFMVYSTETKVYRYSILGRDVYGNKRQEVPFHHEVVLPEAMVDYTSYDLRGTIAKMLQDYYPEDKVVVPLRDIVPYKLRAPVLTYDIGLKPSFLKHIRVSVDVTGVMDSLSGKYESFREVYDNVRETIVSREILCSLDSTSVCVVTKSNILLVNELRKKFDRVYICGFDLSCLGLFYDDYKGLTFVEDSDDVGVVLTLVESLGITALFLDDDTSLLDNLFTSLIRHKTPCKVFVRVSPRYVFENFCALLGCIEYRPRGMAVELNSLFVKLKSFSVKLLRANLRHLFCDLACFMSIYQEDSVVVTDVDVRSDCTSVVDSETSIITLNSDSDEFSVISDSEFSCETAREEVSETVDDLEPEVLDIGVDEVEEVIEEAEEAVEQVTEVYENLEVGYVSVGDQQVLRDFCDRLDRTEATERPGKMGRRFEWLFSHRDYTYSGVTTRSKGDIPVELRGLPLVDGFDTCLIVYYPIGSDGLKLHKDDEPEMLDQAVLTYSVGADCDLSWYHIQDNVTTKIRIKPSQYYLIKNQNRHRHGVKTFGARFALTFRRFRRLDEPVSRFATVKLNPGRGDCLFYSLLGSNCKEDADKLRELIKFKRPDVDKHPAYSSRHVDEECLTDGIWAGTSTIIAFCRLFYSNVVVIGDNGEPVLVFDEYRYPFYSIILRYNGVHYERVTETCGKGLLELNFKFNVTPVVKIFEILQKVFSLGSGPLSRALSWLTGAREISYYPEVGSPYLFHNVLREPCLADSCLCLDSVARVLDDAIGKKCKELFVMVPFEWRHFRLTSELLNSKGLFCKVLVIPGLVNQGFLILMISLHERMVKGTVDLCGTVEHLKMHSKCCDNCKGEVIGSPTYFAPHGIYYFCKGDGHVNRVNFVREFVNVSKVFQLVVVTTDSNIPVSRCIEDKDVVRVPVRLSNVGVLDTSGRRGIELTEALEGFFVDFGDQTCIGLINCGIHDIRFITDIVNQHVARLQIMEDCTEVVDNGIGFLPEYVTSTGDESYIHNAMVEAREYYRATLTTITANLAPLHQQYLKIFSDKYGGASIADTVNNKPDYGLIDMDKGVFVVAPKEGAGPYNYAYDGNKLIDISRAHLNSYNGRESGVSIKRLDQWLRPGVFSGLFSVCKETKLVNSDKILNRLEAYKPGEVSSAIKLIEGVPGCGKTHYIINNHLHSLRNTNHVVLTSSREAALDLRRRVAKTYKVTADSRAMSLRYRTVDSFLMHYCDSDYPLIDVIWLDEGLMKHFGDILWCAKISRCKSLNIIGDRAQIPFVNRVAGITLYYNQIDLSSERIGYEFLNVTHRCPVDVAVLLNRMGVYKGGEGVKSSSRVDRSIKTKLIGNVMEVLRAGCEDYQILTFTQNEKSEVSKMTRKKVFTINEFQGNQAEKILLIRTNPKDIPVFDSENHILVGFSRHTEEFLYATVKKDKCFGICAAQILDGEISSCKQVRNLGGGVIMGKVTTKQYPFSLAVPQCATMIDLVKQNGKIRDFVQRNTGVGVVPMRVMLREIPIELPIMPLAPHYYVSDPVTTMQFCYDSLFPEHSLIKTDYDNEIFGFDDLVFPELERLKFTEFERIKLSNYDGLRPALRTTCPSVVNSSLKQTLKAFYDRNGNVPNLQGYVNDVAVVDNMYNVFVEACVGDRELFDSYVCNPVTINVDSIEDWLQSQTKDVENQAFEDEEFWSIFNREINNYSFILKRLPKPKLDQTAVGKFPSPQTIAHQSKDINAVFCPLFREIKRRLVAVLRDNVILFSDMSVSDFEKLLTVRLPASRLAAMQHLLEVDMSKYDKSQGRVALMFEVKLLRALGFPEHLLPVWLVMHVYTKVTDRVNRVQARLFFQRKSGDGFTFLGNSLHLLGILLTAIIKTRNWFLRLIIDGRVVILFSGDDSLIFMEEAIDCSEITYELALNFNMESKLLKYHTPYFCSKFLCMTPWGRWAIVPDVGKMLIKLGRSDLVNEEHVEEYRISCLDVGQHLGNSLLYPLIDLSMKDRYGHDLDSLGSLYSAMFTAFQSSEVFSTLYFRGDGANISMRKYRKLFDF